MKALDSDTTSPADGVELNTVGTHTVSVMYRREIESFDVTVFADTNLSVTAVYEIYSDIKDLLSYDENTRKFTALDGFESYRWFLNDKKQNCSSNTLVLSDAGTNTVMVVVTQNGRNYSASYRIEF